MTIRETNKKELNEMNRIKNRLPNSNRTDGKYEITLIVLSGKRHHQPRKPTYVYSNYNVKNMLIINVKFNKQLHSI